MIKDNRPYDDEILSGSTSSVLASLYRKILKDLGISLTRFNAMMNRYIDKGVRENVVKDASSKRGNLSNELMQDTMTWSAFVKGLHFLNVTDVTLQVRIYRESDTFTEYIKKAVIISKAKVPDDEDPDTILARMYHSVLHELNFSLLEFSKMMDAYVIKTFGSTNLKDISSRKGNFKKELFKKRMSWNVFVKGLVFLGVWKFDLFVHLKHSNGKITVHGRTIVLEEYDDRGTN